MDKDVFIDIKSMQNAANDSDTTELFTCGKFSREEDKYRIIYEESEVIGFAGNQVVLEVDGDNIVSMNRVGNAASNLIIEKGKKHHCHYGTPYGDFMVGITANEIKSNLDDYGGNLYLKYTVDVNSSLITQNEMYINVREKG